MKIALRSCRWMDCMLLCSQMVCFAPVDCSVDLAIHRRLVHNWCTGGAQARTAREAWAIWTCTRSFVRSLDFQIGSASGVDLRSAHGIAESTRVGESPPLRSTTRWAQAVVILYGALVATQRGNRPSSQNPQNRRSAVSQRIGELVLVLCGYAQNLHTQRGDIHDSGILRHLNVRGNSCDN